MAGWKKADVVLAVTAICFGGALLLYRAYPDETACRLLVAVTEAALVGGLADWFAVTALFRKPLGFGWHTALIPRNRERVIDGISNAIEKEFLSVDSLKKRLAQIRFVELLIEWVEYKEGRRNLRNALEYFLQRGFDQADPKQIAKVLEVFLKSRAGEWPLTAQLQELLTWVLQNGQENVMINYILAELQIKVDSPTAKNGILRYLRNYAEQGTQNWWQKFALEIGIATDSINLEEAAEALQQELVKLIIQLQDPQHPLRRWLRDVLTDLAQHVDSDPQWRMDIKKWQTEFIQKTDLGEVLTILIEVSLQRGQRRAIAWVLLQIDQYWDSVRSDPEKMAWLEKYCKEMVFRILETEHHWIGTVARDALTILTDRDLSAFVEDKAGDDLQWIRINGSVVGGLAGLLLFLFGYFVYDPFVLPLFHRYLP